MEWLTQDWVWVALGVGIAFYFFRGGLGGHAGGHAVVPGGFRLDSRHDAVLEAWSILWKTDIGKPCPENG